MKFGCKGTQMGISIEPKMTSAALSVLPMIIVHYFYLSSAAVTNYGPYIVQVLSIEQCFGEPRDLDHPLTLNITLRKISRTKDEIHGAIDIAKDIKNLKSKLSGEYFTGNSWKNVMDTVDESMCNGIYAQNVAHIVLGEGIDLDKCILKKGTYTFEKLDVSSIMHEVTGDEFFYNRFRVRMEWLTVNGSVVCVIVECISKKP